MSSSNDIRGQIDRLVDACLDGEIPDADWQRHVAEIGPALETALQRETALRASLRALPRAAAPDAVRAAILAHVSQARAAGPGTAPATQVAAPTPGAAPRIIRGGWWWSLSALAAACLVVALSVNRQPGGSDPQRLAYGRDHASAPPAPEQESRQESAAKPATVADEPRLAILEQAKTGGQKPERLGGRFDDGFSDKAKEQTTSKADDTRRAGEAKAALKDDLTLATRDALDGALADEKRASDHLEVAKVVVGDAEEAPGGLAKDARRTHRSDSAEGKTDAAGYAFASAETATANQAGTSATAADDAPVGADGATAKLRKLEAPAMLEAAKPSAPPAAVKKAALDAHQREAGATGADQASAEPAAQPRSTAPNAAKEATSGGLVPTEGDAAVGVSLSLADGNATMTIENHSGQSVVVRRATLVLEALDRSQRSCWMHATGLPAADETVAVNQKRSWSLALLGADAPPVEAVQLRLRLLSRLSVLQAWPVTRPPAASAAPAGVAPASTGP